MPALSKYARRAFCFRPLRARSRRLDQREPGVWLFLDDWAAILLHEGQLPLVESLDHTGQQALLCLKM